MSAPSDSQRMEKIVSLCKRRGFIFQSSEIYGGLNGAWDYGPLGVELKRNLKNYWWRVMVHERDDIVGMDGSILMNRAVWKASGHEDTFSDPMVECEVCKHRYKNDQVPASTPLQLAYNVLFKRGDELLPSITFRVGGSSEKEIKKLADVQLRCHQRNSPSLQGAKYHQHGVLDNFTERDVAQRSCPHCGAVLSTPRPFNLMFKTYVGATEDESSITYLRPETAQAIFVQFKNVLDTSRKKLPFGVAQIGKAFRNEINPRNFTFRSGEVEQMELEYFCRAEEGMKLLEYWKEQRLKFNFSRCSFQYS